jgi:hypothetical protein
MWRRHLIASVVTGTAIGAMAVHVIWPDLKIDGITVVLLVVAVLPWLGDLFTSIELPGGTRLEYKQLEERIEATEERATHLRNEVDGVAATARVALSAAGSADWIEPDDARARDAVERLIAEYVRVRMSVPSSPARTAHQERIFAELVKATSAVDTLAIDDMLGSESAGERLAAYARLYAIPDPARLDRLVDAVLDEGLPFLKYWGFNVLGRVVDHAGADQVPLGVIRRLRACLPELPAGSDRAGALRRLLSKLDVT